MCARLCRYIFTRSFSPDKNIYFHPMWWIWCVRDYTNFLSDPNYKIISANLRLCFMFRVFESFISFHIFVRTEHSTWGMCKCTTSMCTFHSLTDNRLTRRVKYRFYISVERTVDCCIDEIVVRAVLALMHAHISFSLLCFYIRYVYKYYICLALLWYHWIFHEVLWLAHKTNTSEDIFRKLIILTDWS